MSKIQLTISEEQSLSIAEALELHSRLQCGQLKEIENLFRDKPHNSDNTSISLLRLKREYFPELYDNEYYGIYQNTTPEKALDMYETYKQILHFHNKNSDFWNVHRDYPIITKEENKIKIESI